MKTHFGMVAVVTFWVALSPVVSGLRALPDKKIVQAEAAQIKKMAAAGDVDGLVGMLSKGLFVSKGEGCRAHRGDRGLKSTASVEATQ